MTQEIREFQHACCFAPEFDFTRLVSSIFCNSWDCLWTEAPAEEEPDDGLTTEEREALLYKISSQTSEQRLFSSARLVGLSTGQSSHEHAPEWPWINAFLHSEPWIPQICDFH